jgi:hypothetical protein
VEEKLAEISRMVLEWHYGADVEIFASVKLKTKEEMQVASDQSAVISGGKKAGVRAEAANAEEVRSDQSAVSSDQGMEDLMSLLQADFADVAAVIERALQASGSERASLLQEAEAMLPAKIGNEAFDDEVTRLLTEAFLGKGEEAENAGTPDGAIKGWETRRRNGWQSKPRDHQKAVDALVDSAVTKQGDQERLVSYGQLSDQEAELLGLSNKYSHALSNHYVRHMLKSHGNPQTEASRGQIAITPEDIKQIPYIVANSQAAQHAGKKLGADTIRYFYDSPDGTTTILEEIRKSRKMVAVQMLKFKKQNLRQVPYTKK